MPDGRSSGSRSSTRPVQARVHDEYDRRYPLDPDSPAGRRRWSARASRISERHPRRVLGSRRPGSRAAPAAARARLRLRAHRADARARARDRRHRARRAASPGAATPRRTCRGAGAGRPLRAGDRERPAAHRRARRSRDELEAILAGVADAVTAQDARRAARLRQRRRRAAARLPDAQALLRRRRAEIARRFEMPAEDGSRSRSSAAGPARAGRRAPAAADRALPRPRQRARTAGRA